MALIGNKVREAKTAKATAAAEYGREETVELVKQAAGGNFTAFGELYGTYLDRIYRYVYYQVNDKMAAEDITEDVFVKAWKSIESCKGKEATFSSWLYRIAHNHLINVLRREQRLAPIEKVASVELIDFIEELETRAEYRELMENINCLPANQKQVIILKFIEGMENREIGTIMGKREGAVRVLQMRALATLRKRMGKGKDYEQE